VLVIALDSYLVSSYGGPDPCTERKTCLGGEQLDLENFWLSVCHRWPSQQLMSSCGNRQANLTKTSWAACVWDLPSPKQQEAEYKNYTQKITTGKIYL